MHRHFGTVETRDNGNRHFGTVDIMEIDIFGNRHFGNRHSSTYPYKVCKMEIVCYTTATFGSVSCFKIAITQI